jgi:hypothetical protein
MAFSSAEHIHGAPFRENRKCIARMTATVLVHPAARAQD